MRSLRVGLAQMNATVGDLEGNTARILRFIEEAKDNDVDLIGFPELAITGYPPEDLLLKPCFISDNLERLGEIVGNSKGISVVVGFVDAKEDIYNAAAVIHDGELKGIYHKIYLPNYGVFDEERYFHAGAECPVFTINGIGTGINVCEDIWYPAGPATLQAYAGAEVIVNINASPYHAGKRGLRQRMLATRAADNTAIVCYVNMVGGQDELVFDGGSMILDEKGELIAQGKQFEEELVIADLDVEAIFRVRLHDPRRRRDMLHPEAAQLSATRIAICEASTPRPKKPLAQSQAQVYDLPGEVYGALVLGTRDYVGKNGFRKVVIGLSGGIDSSLVAVIAVDALGAENVIGVAMPSRYSSPGSVSDAELLAANLGIRLITIPIEEGFQSMLNMLSAPFEGTQPDVAEENLQARIRGNTIMALSNKFGWLVLTTGNKSEMAVGYATLYGDMAGGFAVIKDVPKTLVYKVAQHRNSLAGKEIIPRSVLEKVPSAELRPDQKDTDTLPPYEVLDPIMQAYVEEDESIEEIVAMGFERKIVERVISMVDRSEYKRRQAPPGVKITHRAFGKDRRLPITNRYRGFCT